jgi:hypothetical protein
MPNSIKIETLEDPLRYTDEQLDQARRFAQLLGHRRLVLCERPGR